MTNFTFSVNDTKTRIREIVLSQIKSCIVIGSLSLALSIYFLLVGIFFDSEALIMGVPLLLIALFMAFLSLHTYFSIIKEVENFILKYAKDGIINYTLQKKDDLYILDCLQNQKVIEFTKSDIAKVYYMKNIIVIKLKSKIIMSLPKIPSIIYLFS